MSSLCVDIQYFCYILFSIYSISYTKVCSLYISTTTIYTKTYKK